MANDLNQCNFIGRLGKDPVVKYTQGGMAIASFSIAVGWKSKDKEGAEWVNIAAFDKLGEICGEYLKKGSMVFISGRMKTEKWQGQDGTDKYTTKIIADKMQMIGGKRDDAQTNAPTQTQTTNNVIAPPTVGDIYDDEIPF